MASRVLSTTAWKFVGTQKQATFQHQGQSFKLHNKHVLCRAGTKGVHITLSFGIHVE